MLRHSDNTLAQLFGRLTALKRQAGNSIKTDTQAVADTLAEQGIDTSGLQMADCSGLTPGSKVDAVMVAVPLPTAVTRPLPSTLATFSSLEV